MSKATDLKRDEARNTLRELLSPGDTVYTILRHRSPSGMSRVIDCVIVRPYVETIYPPLPPDKAAYPGQVDYEAKATKRVTRHYPRTIGGLVCDADGRRWSDAHNGMIVGGCGMDMGFAVVYYTSRVLFPGGFGILGTSPDGRKVRPKTPKQAASMVKRGFVFRGRNGDASGWDNDGGYALSHSWL